MYSLAYVSSNQAVLLQLGFVMIRVSSLKSDMVMNCWCFLPEIRTQIPATQPWKGQNFAQCATMLCRRISIGGMAPNRSCVGYSYRIGAKNLLISTLFRCKNYLESIWCQKEQFLRVSSRFADATCSSSRSSAAFNWVLILFFTQNQDQNEFENVF